MTGSARVLVVLAVAGSILAIGAAPAAACSCARLSAAELLGSSDAAFIGTAVGVDDQRSAADGDRAGFDPAGSTYRFEVEQVLKGELPSTIEVATPPDAGACGASFPLDRRSAVLVHQGGDGWTTTLCMSVTVSQLLRASPEEPRPPSDGEGLATVPIADDEEARSGRLAGLLIIAGVGLGAWLVARSVRRRARAG